MKAQIVTIGADGLELKANDTMLLRAGKEYRFVGGGMRSMTIRKGSAKIRFKRLAGDPPGST